jgi:hypothetical protein
MELNLSLPDKKTKVEFIMSPGLPGITTAKRSHQQGL